MLPITFNHVCSRKYTSMFEFTVNAMVRGYDIQQGVWEVNIGKILPWLKEVSNCHDPHAITV